MKNIFFLLVSVALITPSPAGAAWIGRQVLPLSVEPAAGVALDFNGDGRLDLVVSSRETSLSALKNVAGTIQVGDTTTIGMDARFLAVAGDRVITSDFASASNTEVRLSASTFGAINTIPAAKFPLGLAAGDLNGDGFVDIAQVFLTSSALAVRYGNPDGTFGAPNWVRAGSGPRTVVIDDIDGDGRNDILVATGAKSALVLLRGTGSGFAPAEEFLVGSSLLTVRLADLDGDGKPEVLITDIVSNELRAFRYENSRLVQTGQWTLGAAPVDLALGDLNGDGRIDAAVATPMGLQILLGDQVGGFQSSQLALAGSVNAVVVADLTGDEKPEAIALTKTGVTVLSWE